MPGAALWGSCGVLFSIVVLRMEGCDVRSLRYGLVRLGPKFEIVCSCGVLLSASQQLLVNCVSHVPEQQAHFGLPCTVPRLWFRKKMCESSTVPVHGPLVTVCPGVPSSWWLVCWLHHPLGPKHNAPAHVHLMQGASMGSSWSTC